MSARVLMGAMLLAGLVAGAAGAELTLNKPEGLTFGPDDHLYVADTGNNRVLALDAELKLVREYPTMMTRSEMAEWDLWAPMDVAVEPGTGRVFVANGGNGRVIVFERDGTFVRWFGERGTEPGQLVRPTNITLDGAGHVIVTDRGANRLSVFTVDGEFVSELANRTGPRPEADAEALFEYERSRNANAKRESFDGEWQRTDPGHFHEPGGVYYDAELGRLFVANGWNCRIEILDYDAKTGTITRRPPETGIAWGFWVTHGVAGLPDGGLVGVQTAFGGLRLFHERGELNRTSQPYRDIGAGIFGRMEGVADVAVAPQSGRVAVIDRHKDRVCVFPADFSLPAHPRASRIADDGALITYGTHAAVPTKIRLRENAYPLLTPERYVKGGFGTPVERVIDASASTGHEIELADLKPATRYYYRVHMGEARTVPGDGWTMEYAINTLAADGQTSFITIPVKVLLVANLVAVDSLPDGEDAAAVPEPPKMTAEDVERYYAAMFREMQLHFWVNSRMKYFVELDLYVDHTVYRKGGLKEGAPEWYRALPEQNHLKSLERLIEEGGRADKLYYGQVICEAEQRWDAGRKAWRYQGSGGGTYGVDWPQPGRTHFLGGSDVAWLLAHEYKHQMESQASNSGMDAEDDRMWFCHFSPAWDDPNTPHVDWEWDTAADHGEHWDGVAWQLRHFTQDQYMRLAYGVLETAVDRDGDGIPDDAPRLPLDEKRLGSSPELIDTDDDGVPDLEELLASTWVTALLTDTRARISVPYVRPDPTKVDSDGDGLPDGDDPYPVYPYEPRIPYQKITVDGDLADWAGGQEIAFKHQQLGPAKEDIDATIRACYDADWLYYAIEVKTPQGAITLVCDAEADGFYYGNDNIYLQLKPDGTLQNVRMHLCNNNRWPYFDDKHEVLKPEDIRVASRVEGTRKTIEVALPRRKEIGLTLQEGDRIGLMVYMQMPSGASVSVFEPYWSFPSELMPRE
jgi:DNA-binding beta-propeller fold protein YncE